MGISRAHTFSWLLVVGLVALSLGCGGEDTDEQAADGEETDGVDETPEDDELLATLSSIQTEIFTPTCARAGCHSAASASGGLVLEAGSSFANLVGVASTRSGFNRVEAGDPDSSFLINKLDGTQADVGSGSRMPLGSAALTEGEIEVIRQWIRDGASDN